MKDANCVSRNNMDYLNSLVPILTTWGVAGYWLVLLAAFLESLVAVGVLVPGAVLVTFAGFLSSQGYLDAGDLIWFAAVGAILGDSLGYYLGTKGKRFFHNENKFLKLAHLERGERFFRTHGSKSIFLGRFIGPIRSVVPFVAGLSGMKQSSFLFWNILSGIVWAASHILIGYFFGGVLKVITLWSTRVGFLFILIALVVFIAWFIWRRIIDRRSFLQ